jgi:hypothetical protein
MAGSLFDVGFDTLHLARSLPFSIQNPPLLLQIRSIA